MISENSTQVKNNHQMKRYLVHPNVDEFYIYDDKKSNFMNRPWLTTLDFFIHWLKPNIATKISQGLKFT